MRNSGEAQCPNPKYVKDPTNTDYSIQDVFFNICGLVDGGWYNQISVCLSFLRKLHSLTIFFLEWNLSVTRQK